MKYVLLKHPATGAPRVCLGLAPDTHEQICSVARREGFTPVSAGFCRVIDAAPLFECYGHSDSLGLVSHPDDSRVLAVFYHQTVQLGLRVAVAPRLSPSPIANNP
ncbi:MAG: hypothetical protein HZA93_24085 [Verrucomicrobia bacterium]|nr:hypothetical protein [Verrucomicrobiota bacterium]